VGGWGRVRGREVGVGEGGGGGGVLTVRFLCTVVELGVLPSGKEIGVDDVEEVLRRVRAPRRDQVTGLSSLLLLCAVCRKMRC